MTQPLSGPQQVRVGDQTMTLNPPDNYCFKCFAWLYDLVASLLTYLRSCFSNQQPSLNGRASLGQATATPIMARERATVSTPATRLLPSDISLDRMKEAAPEVSQWLAEDGAVDVHLAYNMKSSDFTSEARDWETNHITALPEDTLRTTCQDIFNTARPHLQNSDYRYYILIALSKIGSRGPYAIYLWQNLNITPPNTALPVTLQPSSSTPATPQTPLPTPMIALPSLMNFDTLLLAQTQPNGWLAKNGAVDLSVIYTMNGRPPITYHYRNVNEGGCRHLCNNTFNEAQPQLQNPQFKYFIQFSFSKHHQSTSASNPHHGPVETFTYQNFNPPSRQQPNN